MYKQVKQSARRAAWMRGRPTTTTTATSDGVGAAEVGQEDREGRSRASSSDAHTGYSQSQDVECDGVVEGKTFARSAVSNGDDD